MGKQDWGSIGGPDHYEWGPRPELIDAADDNASGSSSAATGKISNPGYFGLATFEEMCADAGLDPLAVVDLSRDTFRALVRDGRAQ